MINCFIKVGAIYVVNKDLRRTLLRIDLLLRLLAKLSVYLLLPLVNLWPGAFKTE